MKTRNVATLAVAAIGALLSFATVAVADNITGTQGPDVLTGTEFDDHIVAKKGDDQVSALTGNDNVSGNKGDDVLNGDEGNDTLTGNKGADQINGGPGNDLIKARGDGKKSGPDTITCGEDAEEYSTRLRHRHGRQERHRGGRLRERRPTGQAGQAGQARQAGQAGQALGPMGWGANPAAAARRPYRASGRVAHARRIRLPTRKSGRSRR